MVCKWHDFATNNKIQWAQTIGFNQILPPPPKKKYFRNTYLQSFLWSDLFVTCANNFKMISFVLILILIFWMPTALNKFFLAITTCNYWFSSKKSKNPSSNFLWYLIQGYMHIKNCQKFKIYELLNYHGKWKSETWLS